MNSQNENERGNEKKKKMERKPNGNESNVKHCALGVPTNKKKAKCKHANAALPILSFQHYVPNVEIANWDA